MNDHSFACFRKDSNRVDISTLPPLMMQQTRLPSNRLSFSTAATTVAEEGYITNFIRYITS
jgi:hypothetical protein